MISLTDFAADKVRQMITQREQPTEGLRVGVRGGGCSGFTYFLVLTEGERDGDRKIESHGIPLFIDSKSYLYLMGTEVDDVEGLSGAGFKFQNPNARRTCGCGESFSL